MILAAVTADVWGQQKKEPAPTPVPVIKPGRDAARPAANEDASENVFLPPDRHTLQKLSDARKLMADERFGEAVRYLGDILEAPEDFFFQPDKSSPIHRSLKAEAERLIGQMPREGRELYELQYGARARRMLEDSLSPGDMAALAEISRRFFHTRGGYQATFLLGLDHFEHGRPLAGALTLQRLREAGEYAEELEPALSLTTAACWLQTGATEKARKLLVSLRQRRSGLRVTVAGHETPMFTDDAEAIDWLAGLIGSSTAANPAEADRWLMFRGDAARNAAAAGGRPLLNTRWRVAVTDDPQVQAALEQYARQCAEQGVPAMPALHPLAVSDVLLMRTARNLLAVDFSTGKRLWEAPEDDAGESTPGVPAGDAQARQQMLLAGVGQRLWGDLTYGALSSDGRCVFAVEDLDTGVGAGNAVRMGPFGGGIVRIRGIPTPEQTGLSNRLAAYDVRTGKLKWNLGGPAGQYALRQFETFFLGPPLPVMGQLYVLGEIKGEVRLMALDGATGNLLWSQQLAVSEQGVVQDAMRRWAGVSPSYADGILVCPTSTGAIVGVDLATRSLLWGYRYSQGRLNDRPRFGAPMVVASTPASPRWLDGSISIVDGRVLATPVESDTLYCLSLLDGELFWKTPRGTDLYVACADRKKVVLVGSHAVRALRMADGKPAWDGRTVELPEKSMPSGRGFLSGDRYFLPLSNAQVIGIDLDAAKIVDVAKSEKGSILGNLICCRGKVIAQGIDGVDEYYQLDAVQAESERRLAVNHDDAEALTLRGEILLDAGKRSEAVAAFQRAYELNPDPRTRELLRDSLLDGLRTEFAAYRDRGGEVERLLDDPVQQATYLRLMADGLRQSGQWTAAFEHYQKLIDLDAGQPPLDQVSKNLAVRRDRWFQSQLVLLRNEARGEAAAQIDAAVETRMKAALAAGSIDGLRRFLDYFGNQPTATVARNELVRRLKIAGRLLEAELADSRGGNTKEQSPEVRTHDETARRPKEQNANWPVGEVQSSKTTTKYPAGGAYRLGIDLRSGSEPFFSDVSLRFDQTTSRIAADDGWGRPLWHISLAGDGQLQNFSFNRAWTHARAEGHLLVVALGWKIVAIDTLGPGRGGGARLLWSQDLMGSNLDPSGLGGIPRGFPNLPWQMQNRFASLYERSGLLGPVTSRCVCFQRFRSLVAVDPHNGEILWVRQDVSPGSEVFGDDQYLIVVSPDLEEATLLRTADGELLGTRKVPRISNRRILATGEPVAMYSRLDESCLATLGRRMLLWWPDGDKRTLTLVDPAEGRDVWPGRNFSRSAHACIVDDKAVGVLEPSGRFVLVNVADGQTIADVKLDSEPSLMDITLLADEGRYLVLTRAGALPGSKPAQIQPMPNCIFKPIYRGKLYAIDEQGKLLWPEPAVIKNQFLMADQPAHLPLVTFCCQAYEQKLNGEVRQKMSLLCIDTRNGRTAYRNEFPNSAGVFDIAGDPEKKTVDVIMQRDTVKLTFTDKPIPPPSATSPAKSPQGGIMQKLLDRLKDEMGLETEEEEKPDRR